MIADDTDQPDGPPDLTGWMEHTPGRTTYQLPERGTLAQADEVVLLMDYLESHISRIRFQLFLEQLVEGWPDTVHCLCVYMVRTRHDPNHPLGFYWKGWALGHPDEQGVNNPMNEAEPTFWQLLHDAAYPDDQGFWLLVREHFGEKTALKTITRAKAQALIEAVIPQQARALMAQEHLDKSLQPTVPGQEEKVNAPGKPRM